MVNVKSICSIVFVILLRYVSLVLSLEGGNNNEEVFLSQLVDPVTGKFEEDLVELLWISCRQDFIAWRDADKDLIHSISEGRSWPLKQTLLDCIQRNKNLFHVSGGVDSNVQHADYLDSLLPRPHIPRRNLLQSIAMPPSAGLGSPLSSPAPAPSPNLPPAPSPEPATPSPAPSPTLPFSPHTEPPPPPLPPAEDSSAGPIPGAYVEWKSGNGIQRSVVIAVVVTAAVTFVLVALLFLCCYIGRSVVRQTDERPLLSMSLGDYFVASSNKAGSFGNSIEEEKLGSEAFDSCVTNDGKGSFMNSNAYVKSNSLHASLDQTPSDGVIGGTAKLHAVSAETPGNNVAPVPPFPGQISSNPPLKPPPGRFGPLPQRPPASVGPPPPAPSATVFSSPPPPMAPSVKPSPCPPPPPGMAPPRPPPPAPFGSKVPRPPLVSKPMSNASSGKGASSEGNTNASKTKLKPFFWDKVLAAPDRSMVWHQIKSGSFQFNEEMIEALFGAAPGDKNKNEQKKESTSLDAAPQFVRILDPKKAQNLSIMLRAMNVTIEEVCDAFHEGNELPVEILHALLKMAPTNDEELKLRLYNGEISQLGPAERFLKELVGIPFAFKRLEALLFMCSLQEEVTSTKESFETLEVACKELRNSRLFRKLLEAVLKTGNRMNDGTFRGGAQAFKLDTLLKLSDVKGTDGKTTLLHFVVQEMVRFEGVRAARAARENRSFSSVSVKTEDLVEEISADTEEHYRSLGLQVVSRVSTELENVKKAAAVDADSLTGTVSKLGCSLSQTKDFLEKEMNTLDEDSGFCETLKSFVQNAKVDITLLQEEEKRIMALVKSTGDYFHGNAGKDEGLRLFAIVRDFLIVLDRVCREVGEAQKRAAKSLRKETATASSPADPRQRLFPAIKERRAHASSSSSDDEN